MRVPSFALVVIAVVVVMCSIAGPARAQAPRIDDALLLDAVDPALELSLSSTFLDVAPATAASSPAMVVPPQHMWIVEDGRPFWYAAGASSVVNLGAHVLVGLPAMGFASVAATSLNAAAAAVPLILGVAGAYILIESALAAVASTVVFGATSTVYDGNWLVSFAAHVGGTALGLAVSAVPFGAGFMLLSGVANVADFTGGIGSSALVAFSILGAIPAVVIGGIALVAVPALVAAWATCVSATPKAGFVLESKAATGAPPSSTAPDASPRADSRALAPTQPLLTLALPGT
jgi:hypothetical protein